jgi:FkbM family methyltransferase
MRIADKWKQLCSWIGSGGWPATLTFLLLKTAHALRLPRPAAVRIGARQAGYPVAARLGDSSDLAVFQQIFLHDEYACLRQIADARVILDLGANVGYSSAYFLSCFPAATVLAVEPDPDNYAACCRNLAPYGKRAKVVLGAAWSTRSRVALSKGGFRDGREWSRQVLPAGPVMAEAWVEAWDIPSLLEMAGGEPIDIMKIDVERSELDIFGNGAESWLPKVRNICIELHGRDCEDAFFGALSGFQYELRHSGELTVCLNLRRRT